MDLKGRNIVVFDLEIKNEIKDGVSWKDFGKMGISVGCSFNFATNDYKVFMDDNIHELAEDLDKAELAVGFNTLGFDVPLLENIACLKLIKDHHYDILFHSRKAHGGGSFVKGFKLDNHLAGTFGKEWMKTGNGAMAPVWYQEKRMGKLITYCLDDVKREAKLFKYLWENGSVKLDSYGELKFLKKPQDFIEDLKGRQLEMTAI